MWAAGQWHTRKGNMGASELLGDGEGVNFDWTRAGPVSEQPEMMNRAWVGFAAS